VELTLATLSSMEIRCSVKKKVSWKMRKLMDERFEYDSIMSGIMKRNDCFNYKAPCTFIKPPEDFENHKPCEDSKKW